MAIGAGLYYVLFVLKVIPFSAVSTVELIAAAGLGFVIITVLGREITKVAVRLFGERRGSMVYSVYRFIAYIALALSLLALVGVSGTELLAGGTFAGLVLGLAGQTVLANIVAGVMILFTRPYEIDDRITFTTWQFGVIAPIYPPKFYSNDLLTPGYSGIVRDIGLAYTEIRLDDGPMIKVPNNVMAQAAIVSHDLSERWVRTKYEVPSTIEPGRFLSEVSKAVKKNEWVTQPDSVQVMLNAATSTVYVVSVDALCRGQYEEPPRSSILLDLMSTVEALK
ncbi:MAG: mechanosensitive ion channel family protein [Nitrososphaerota archaeon]|nr:mechanosensitive ion channel family protein [Nitrososphaerota archaeon]